MTEIYWQYWDRGFLFTCKGHCDHDVCTAVTAITNTLAQLAEDYESAGRASLSERYESGNVKLELFFDKKRDRKRFQTETRALMQGFELYAANFPHAVKVLKVSSPLAKLGTD